jgi:hypothetical protein
METAQRFWSIPLLPRSRRGRGAGCKSAPQAEGVAASIRTCQEQLESNHVQPRGRWSAVVLGHQVRRSHATRRADYYEVVDKVVTQSSDNQYHCIAITLFWLTKSVK